MRKDGKSQYQLKKEKLLKIKNMIEEQKTITKKIWEAKTETEKKRLSKQWLTNADLVTKIWEIVKDE